MSADELQHFLIVHQCLLAITAWHHQNVKDSRFRYAYIRRKPKTLHVANGRNFFPDDLNG
nr:hypothetical protein [Occallatibacter savannae]